MSSAAPDSTVVTTEVCDIFVVGGGPGGAAIATLLAKAGFDVVLAEKERHPRFHIGELLLPHSLPILEELGVLDEVRKVGVFKPGAEFVSEDATLNPQFRFDRALTPGPSHAYQVRRADFDKILFDRARSVGVRTLEGARAQIQSCDEFGVTVAVRSDDGRTQAFHAGLLADASGRSALTARFFGEYHPDRKQNSAAIFAHFTGIPRMSGDRGGNIRIHLTDFGWIWQIPLKEDITSVGLVMPADLIAKRSGSIQEYFHEHAARNKGVAEFLATANQIGEMRVTSNFSYHADRLFGPGFVRIGDAYGFIDPIFSTGVHLALLSANEAARAIIPAWNQPDLLRKYLSDYDRSHRRRINYISWFIYHINDKSFRRLILNPRDFLGIEKAIVSLLAGDFSANKKVAARLVIFKAIHKFEQLRNMLMEKRTGHGR